MTGNLGRMDEEQLEGPAADAAHRSDAASERTGVPAVDRVLAEVETVGELPVTERVAVFERAHEELRRALDANPVHDVAGR